MKYITSINKEKLEDIFVEEYIKKDGSREYDAIRFYSKNFKFLADNFIKTDDLRITKNNEAYTHIRIKAEKYNFKKATDESRLLVFGTTNKGYHTEIKASKENCDHLEYIILKYMIPNLI